LALQWQKLPSMTRREPRDFRTARVLTKEGLTIEERILIKDYLVEISLESSCD
jgi:hypothetical protein